MWETPENSEEEMKQVAEHGAYIPKKNVGTPLDYGWWERKIEREKQEVRQLIDDIGENEWFCVQYGSECEMTQSEKEFIISGLKLLLES